MITESTHIDTYKNHVSNLKLEEIMPDIKKLAKIIVNEILKKEEQLT